MPLSKALQLEAKQYLGDHTSVRACPFCGSDNLVLVELSRANGTWTAISCTQCKTLGPQGQDASGALAMWQGVILQGLGILTYARRRVIRVRRPNGGRTG